MTTKSKLTPKILQAKMAPLSAALEDDGLDKSEIKYVLKALAIYGQNILAELWAKKAKAASIENLLSLRTKIVKCLEAEPALKVNDSDREWSVKFLGEHFCREELEEPLEEVVAGQVFMKLDMGSDVPDDILVQKLMETFPEEFKAAVKRFERVTAEGLLWEAKQTLGKSVLIVDRDEFVQSMIDLYDTQLAKSVQEV